jgi:prevent-host-death family protein
MATTYSVTEAQAKFPAVVREAAEQPVIITRRDKVVGYLLSPERFETLMETMEILANPEAMKAIRDAEEGKTKYYPLSILDEPGDED